MAATISKPYRLVNPGRKRVKRNPRRMSLKQKLHFGTARQRAAAKVSLRGSRGKKRNPRKVFRHMKAKGYPRRVRRALMSGNYAKASHYAKRSTDSGKRKKRSNVGSILTVFNPGVKTTMARRRKRVRVNSRRRRRNLTYDHKSGPRSRRRYIYKNPRRRRRAVARTRVIHRRSRRHNPARRRHYRRNPGMFSGSIGKVLGIIGGATVTKLVTEQVGAMVAMASTGIPSYIAGALVAFLQGKLAGKVLKNPGLGENMQIGGYTYVALKVLGDLVPALSLPFGLNGMGLITSSANFGQPYVPVPGSMARFVTPGGVMAAIPPPAMAGVRGLGRTGSGMRRMGRLA